MSRESEIAAILYADATLTAILTGGIYVNGGIYDEDEDATVNDVGPEGITRETTPDAFDGSGYLLPCALVRQRPQVTTDIMDWDAQIEGARQYIVVWLYQDRGYTAIDSAVARIRALLFGTPLSGGYELQPTQLADRERDPGPLNLASMARYEWQIDSIVQ